MMAEPSSGPAYTSINSCCYAAYSSPAMTAFTPTRDAKLYCQRPCSLYSSQQLCQEPKFEQQSGLTPLASDAEKPPVKRRRKDERSVSEGSDEQQQQSRRRRLRYKTPSPAQLRGRREAANARERKRMNSLNVAFDLLRGVLPELEAGRKLSKYETLQLAQHYINNLQDLLSK